MSTIDQAVVSGSSVECGNCKHLNAKDAKFCGGCGHAVFEPCAQCQSNVRLTQKFCADCGADLDAILEKRIVEIKQTLANTLTSAKEHKYDSAIERLSALSKITDYRFASFATQAKQALPKVIQLREQVGGRVQKSQEDALAAFERGDHEQVIQLLADFPKQLLSEASIKALNVSSARVAEIASVKESLRQALESKDWCAAGSNLERSLELFPEDAALKRMAEKVSSKLMSTAETLFAKGDSNKALVWLDCVPLSCQNESYSDIKNKIATVAWLNSQLSAEPFATPGLGKLAVRLTKESPGDSVGPEMVAKLATILKEPRRDASIVYPPWKARRESSLGGEFAILGWPQKIDFSGQTDVQKNPARFGVALGLALQAIDSVNFNTSFTQKQSFFSKLSLKRGGTTAWGVDVGTSSVKAVQIKKDGDKLSIVNAYLADYAEVAKPGRDTRGFLAMRESLKEMVTKLDIGDAKVWINYPSRDILGRFVELPPVDNKKAAALLELEAKGQFPVNADELEVLKWVADKPEREGIGRPAALVAARNFLLKQRWDFLAEVGLKPEAMQCESIALMNHVVHECKELLEYDESTSSTVPAIAVIDAGATSTTICVVASKRFWFRTIDGGGEELTSALARSAKVVRDEAERLKKSLHELPLPAVQYQPIEEKQEALHSRINQLLTEMLRENRDVKIVKTLVTGGACFGFGWIRRTVCKR